MTLDSVYDFIKNIFFIRFDNATDVAKAVIEISIFAYILYKVMQLVRETRAWQLLKGIILVLGVTVLSNVLGFRTLSFVLNNTFNLLAIGAFIIFQPELRRGLEQIGRSTLKDIFGGDVESVKASKVIDAVVRAAAELSKTNTGALIIVEKETKLGEIIKTGITINADATAELLINIFTPNTPLHDGAVIIRGSRILAAGCLLPLTDDLDLSKNLGTRHRAAIGVTEISDAICVVISEETGKISIAQGGELTFDVTKDSLREILTESIQSPEIAVVKKRIGFLRGKEKYEQQTTYGYFRERRKNER